MEEGAHHIVQAGRIAGGAGDTVSGLPIARLPELAGNRIPTSRQSASARARPAPGSRDGSIRSRLLVGVRLPVADGLGLGNEGLGARQPATEVSPPRVSGLVDWWHEIGPVMRAGPSSPLAADRGWSSDADRPLAPDPGDGCLRIFPRSTSDRRVAPGAERGLIGPDPCPVRRACGRGRVIPLACPSLRPLFQIAAAADASSRPHARLARPR